MCYKGLSMRYFVKYFYYFIKLDIIEIFRWYFSFILGKWKYIIWMKNFFIVFYFVFLENVISGCLSRWGKCNLFVRDYVGF